MPDIHDGHRERMKRQFLRGGIDQFEPHQVLELLLFYALPRKDTNPIAHRLLNYFGSLPAVLDADYEDLCRVEGISEHSATLLVLCGQLLARYYREQSERLAFAGSIEIVEYLKKRFVNEKKEKVLLLSLNHRGQLLNCSVVHTGTITSSEASTRELVQTALRHRATAVVLAHNHPAGRCLPSVEDVEVTKAIVPAFNMMEIELVDHYIFAENEVFSMRDSPYYAPSFSGVISRLRK